MKRYITFFTVLTLGIGNFVYAEGESASSKVNFSVKPGSRIQITDGKAQCFSNVPFVLSVSTVDMYNQEIFKDNLYVIENKNVLQTKVGTSSNGASVDIESSSFKSATIYSLIPL